MNGGTGMTGLEIDRVSKRYGDVVALREMTFEVRPGEVAIDVAELVWEPLEGGRDP